jgi:hypothetical protein
MFLRTILTSHTARTASLVNFLSILYGFLTKPSGRVEGQADMQTLVSFPASGTTSQELGPILSDYLALDRARIFRRLMVARFAVLALSAALLESVVRGFSPFARVFTVAVCLVPPFWARLVELGRERRLSRRMERVDGAVTHKF